MEAVTPEPLIPEGARQRETPRQLRHPSMEGGVKACDLRQTGEAAGHLFDELDLAREMERRERNQPP